MSRESLIAQAAEEIEHICRTQCYPSMGIRRVIRETLIAMRRKETTDAAEAIE